MECACIVSISILSTTRDKNDTKKWIEYRYQIRFVHNFDCYDDGNKKYAAMHMSNGPEDFVAKSAHFLTNLYYREESLTCGAMYVYYT